MESYLPSQAFKLQYPEWFAWPPKALRGMVDGETLSKGALLFVDGRITSLRFLKKETGFEAMLQDGEPRTATAQMQKDGNPTWQCGCRNKSVKEPCQHVVAVLAALSYIFHEYNFLNLSPIQPNVNLLAKCIDSSAARVQKKLTQLKLETTDNDAYVIRGNAALHTNSAMRLMPILTLLQ